MMQVVYTFTPLQPSTFTSFVDVQKAFDSANRDFLLNKILPCGVNGKVFQAIKSLYSNV